MTHMMEHPRQPASRHWAPSAVALLPLLVVLGACGDRSRAQSEDSIREMAEEVIPRVEQAAGLTFKSPPELALRSREQVRHYLDAKIAAELPPDEVERLTVAYRMFGLIPDTLDLSELLLELYAEQVAGFYDPDSTVLYVVEGSDPAMVRLTIAHELVHALQDQYMPVDSVLTMQRQNDRRTAAQAVLEGQAMLASVLAMMPNQDLQALGTFWNDAQRRSQIREQEKRMPVFASAPLILREGLIFPYLAGADFMNWFARLYPDTVPFGPRMPASTEQILHPDRYASGDQPVDLMFLDSAGVVYEDNLGEFETRVMLTELTESETAAAAVTLGWGGDRYAVTRVGDGYGLTWWSVWDDEVAADRFARVLDREWAGRETEGRYLVERSAVGAHAAVLFMYGPESWARWGKPLRVAVAQ